jgi:hypothetical protein
MACSVCKREMGIWKRACFEDYTLRQLMTISPLVCTGPMHRPTTLRCGHTFCAGCLTRSSDNVHLLCASCNGETGTTDRLPIDYIISNMCPMPSDDRIAAATECAVCLTPLMHKPKTLVCGHTFCGECVDRINNDRRVQCTNKLHTLQKNMGRFPMRKGTRIPLSGHGLFFWAIFFYKSDLLLRQLF